MIRKWAVVEQAGTWAATCSKISHIKTQNKKTKKDPNLVLHLASRAVERRAWRGGQTAKDGLNVTNSEGIDTGQRRKAILQRCSELRAVEQGG